MRYQQKYIIKFCMINTRYIQVISLSILPEAAAACVAFADEETVIKFRA